MRYRLPGTRTNQAKMWRYSRSSWYCWRYQI
nr:MAG TPA: hypothetical protein [Caudoviricetes sp.]